MSNGLLPLALHVNAMAIILVLSFIVCICHCPMRIGLYGGSFDPVHLGHLLVAQAALEEAELDRVVFIPAAQSPFKPDRQLSADTLRAAMLRLALTGKSWASVDTQELERGGISFTIDTVRNYSAKIPEAQFCYLIGSDHVPQLPKWREAAELASRLEFLVIPRPGGVATPFPAPFRGQFLKGFPLGLSASQIRERVRKALPVDLLVPPGVTELVRNNGLYL
jgi:nicotinate-nucleotide adenylyltransferase